MRIHKSGILILHFHFKRVCHASHELVDALLIVWTSFKSASSVISLIFYFFNKATFFRLVLQLSNNKKIKLSFKDFVK